jgi:hypothetical protein
MSDKNIVESFFAGEDKRVAEILKKSSMIDGKSEAGVNKTQKLRLEAKRKNFINLDK